MKNSLDVIASSEEDFVSSASFELLRDFSYRKDLSLISFRVKGEIPRSDLLVKYLEEFPEDADDAIKGSYVDMVYDTKAKDGNIIFKIVDGHDIHLSVCTSLVLNELNDTFYSMDRVEGLLLKYFSSNLCMLHDSTHLFTELYLNATKHGSSDGHSFTESLD